jgi:Flp pilus assembly pilin Flp
MNSIRRQIWNEERAQDLIEYTMLMAGVALVAAGLMLNVGGGLSGIWKSGDTQLTAANTASAGDLIPTAAGGNHRGGSGGNDGGHRND